MALTRCTGSVYLVFPNPRGFKCGARSRLLMAIVNFFYELTTPILTPARLAMHALHPLHPRRFAAGFYIDNLPPPLLALTSLAPFAGQVGVRGARSHAQQLLPMYSYWLDENIVEGPTGPSPSSFPRLQYAPADNMWTYTMTDRLAKEQRERPDKNHHLTNQVSPSLGDAAMFLRHSRLDAPTVNISLNKRIHPVAKHLNQRQFASALADGQILIDRFVHATGLTHPIAFDEVLFESCFMVAEDKWLRERTFADIKRVAEANPPDWDPLFTKLFLKGQVVRKLGALNAPAKPGQIVTTFPLGAIFHEAPWATYAEEQLRRLLPPHIFLYGGNTPAVFRDWYKNHWVAGECTGTDYTSWDTGCNAPFLVFDVWLFRWLGLPEAFIDHYVHRKLNVRCFMGTMPIMQCSGDRWTWFLNSIRNIAFTHNKFSIPWGTPQCYSGDDMLLCGYAHVRRSFDPSRWILQVKLERGPRLTFCGWLLGDSDLTIGTHQLYARCRHAKAVNAPHSTWQNYARLAFPFPGESTILDDEHQAATNIIIEQLALSQGISDRVVRASGSRHRRELGILERYE